jgi:hypothetical protein
MADIKDLSAIGEKWKRVTPQRAVDYEAGIRNPRSDWATATKDAETRYNEGVQKAIQRKAFGKGVAKAGTQVWQERALAVGPGRFQEGVATSGDNFERGFQPFADTIKATQLPPRFPKGDPRNLERVKVMSQALRAKKESLS